MVNGWKTKKLGEVAEVCMCKRIFAHQTSKIGNIPFYKIGTFGKEADAYISSQLYEEYKAKYSYPEKGDVLISAAGTLGRTVVFDGHPAYFQDSNIVWLKIDKSQLCNDYLAHYYKVIQWASPEGSTISRLYNGIICDTEILLPPLEEQTAIAEALSDIDSLISSLEKLIEKKKAIKQGAMQELLTGKKRLPGFCQKWAKKYLKEIIVPRKERVNPAEIDNRRCIELEHIEPNSGKILGYCESKEQKSLKTIFYPNDILWGKLRPYLRKYAHPKFSGVCSTEFWVFNAINQYACNDFMYYLLQTEDFVSAANSTTGTKMPRADWNLVQELEVKIPADKNEQRAIAQLLSNMDSEIEQLEKKLVKYQQIKQGMMQELLTGRIRLKEGENNA